jgi:hypothetical protein
VSFLGRAALGAALAAAAVGYYAKRKHDATGAGYVEVLLALPGDVQRFADDVRERSKRAVDEGLIAARAREAELTRQLESGSHPAAPTQ